MKEDFLQNRQPQVTEYVGKSQTHSDGLYGHQGVSPDAAHRHRSKTPLPQIHTRGCSFFLDEEPLDLDLTENSFVLPPFEVADKLLTCYMQNVQDSYQ